MLVFGLRALLGSEAWGSDGRLGVVSDFLLDQRAWRAGFMVIASGRRASDPRALFPVQMVIARDAAAIRLACFRAAMDTVPKAPGTGRLLSGLCSVAGALCSAARASDGPVGWLKDIVVEAGTWRVRHIVLAAGAAAADMTLDPSAVETLAGERGVVVRLRTAEISS